MKLNLDILCDHLPSHCRAKRYGAAERTLTLIPPLPYVAGRPMRVGYSYITKTEALPDSIPAGINMICVGGELPERHKQNSGMLLHLQGVSDVIVAMGHIQNVFVRFEEWDSHIRDALENSENFDIEQIIRLGVEVFRNPVGVSNHVLDNIFYGEPYTDESGNPRVRMRDNHPDSPLKDPARSQAIRDVCSVERQFTEPYLSTIPDVSYAIYCNNVYSYGSFMGCLHISGNYTPLRESDFALADYYFPLLRNAFLKHIVHNLSTPSPESMAVQKLLTGKALNGEDQRRLELQEDESYVAISLQSSKGERSMPREYMCSMICSMIPDRIYCALWQEGIHGLLRLSANAEDILERLRNLMKRMGYVGSISNCFRSPQQLPEYIQQSRFVLAYHTPQCSEECLQSFQNYVLDYMFCAYRDVVPVHTLYTDGLRKLIAYDQRRGSDSVQTLRVYLDSESSITKTAELLYIHRSSLLKRLEKIQRILGMDLEDPNVRLYLQICLRLMYPS